MLTTFTSRESLGRLRERPLQMKQPAAINLIA